MSKELTEKWKNKELKDGDYYVINKAGDIVCDYYIEILGHFDSVLTENVKEVLAPVPSYKDYEKLRKLPLKCFQLEEDNSALMVINKDMCKKIERLQEQLKEANEVIESRRTYDFTVDDENAEYYQVKWNVKAKRFYKNRKWGVK